MYASREFLKGHAALASKEEKGPSRLQPTQFSHTLEQARLDPTIAYYHHSLLRMQSAASRVIAEEKVQRWGPKAEEVLRGAPPLYCSPPNEREDEAMQVWIRAELKVHN
jgi:hypothetical protein